MVRKAKSNYSFMDLGKGKKNNPMSKDIDLKPVANAAKSFASIVFPTGKEKEKRAREKLEDLQRKIRAQNLEIKFAEKQKVLVVLKKKSRKKSLLDIFRR